MRSVTGIWARREMLALRRLAAVMALLAGCTGIPAGVEPVAPFDIERYQGTWFEIARLDHRFERGLSHVTATYTLRDDGTVEVLNRGLDPVGCRWREARGTARFAGPREVGSLVVTFFRPFSGGYHVFALDTDHYRWAAVAGPSRNYLWILARTPDLPRDILDPLIETARALGFPVSELIFVEHGPTGCPPETAAAAYLPIDG
jgi:apolipoprotein D and lipocalin family protein